MHKNEYVYVVYDRQISLNLFDSINHQLHIFCVRLFFYRFNNKQISNCFHSEMIVILLSIQQKTNSIAVMCALHTIVITHIAHVLFRIDSQKNKTKI